MTRSEELEVPGEPHLSYALMPYEPLADPMGKLRSANLLWWGFDELDVPTDADRLVAASVAEMGASGTAWGIKQQGDAISWELYYYFHWDHRPLTTTRLERILAASPYASAPLPRSDRSWYSLSFDIPPAVLRGEEPVTGFHTYATHFPAEPRTALSYALGAHGQRLENVYYLFHPVRDRAAVEAYLATSAQSTGDPGPATEVLWPELAGGDHLALAHKPTCDGIYFGGIGVDGLLAFLRRTGFAPWMTERVAAEQARLDHLRFDVGFDFVWRHGHAEVVKAGFYGVV